jgi:hypothetical protein
MRAAVVLCAALVALAALRADAAPKALSTDGEATVYLSGDFRRDFLMEYNVQFATAYDNKGSSTFAITFLGGPPPSDAVTVGVYGVARSGRVFTSVTRDGRSTFRPTRHVCAPACRLSLRGDVNGLSAFIDDVWLQSWPRFSIGAPAPAFQLNGEVSTPGDRVIIVVSPARTRAAGKKLGMPTCGFTTRGISVREEASGALSFAGIYTESAPASYVKLPSRYDAADIIRDRCERPLMIPTSE